MRYSSIRRLALLTLLLVLATVLSAQAGKEQIYTIKKGDTLWGISKRFIDDPYYWPSMWSHNPDIPNPHLIFPGQKIRVIDGRLEIIPAYPTPAAKAEPAAVAEQPQVDEVIQIRSAGSGVGFILTDEQPLGILVDSVDNRVLLTKGDLVFLKMNDPQDVTVGDTYSLYSRAEVIRHPQTEEPLGTMMHDLGFLQVTEVNPTIVTAKIGEIYREIERGAEVFPYAPPRKEITLKKVEAVQDGLLIASRENKALQGASDVVFINLGTDDGVQPGNLFYITRPRQLSTELTAKVGEVELPKAVLGAAVVIEPKLTTSSAIIIKSVDGMGLGDQVSVAEQ